MQIHIIGTSWFCESTFYMAQQKVNQQHKDNIQEGLFKAPSRKSKLAYCFIFHISEQQIHSCKAFITAVYINKLQNINVIVDFNLLYRGLDLCCATCVKKYTYLYRYCSILFKVWEQGFNLDFGYFKFS